MLKLSAFVPPCIIGLAAYSPTVRPITEEQQGGKPQPAVNAAPAPGSAPKVQQQGQSAAEPQVDQTIDSVEAEGDATSTDNIQLNSNTGLAFLLTKLITAAKDSNQIDALAASFVEKLRIKDYDLFKKETGKFSTIEGYSQLLNSIASMVDSSGSEPESSKGDDNGGGNNNGGGMNDKGSQPVNEIWKNYRPLNR